MSIRFRYPVVCRRSQGFALIVVLWTLVLIGFIVAHITASGRTEIRIANNLAANAVALAAADGAIYEAVFNLSDPRPDQRWPVDGSPRELLIGHTQVTLRLENEAWWINPNSAPPAPVEALLRVAGSDAETSRRLAYAISEWVGSAPAPRPPNVVVAEYHAAGLDYGPPAAPLETLEELGRVVGMTLGVLAANRPHLTLFGPPQPNSTTADPIIAAALAAASQAEIAPSPLQPPPDVLTTRITATAFGPGDASTTRLAIARLGLHCPAATKCSPGDIGGSSALPLASKQRPDTAKSFIQPARLRCDAGSGDLQAEKALHRLKIPVAVQQGVTALNAKGTDD